MIYIPVYSYTYLTLYEASGLSPPRVNYTSPYSIVYLTFTINNKVSPRFNMSTASRETKLTGWAAAAAKAAPLRPRPQRQTSDSTGRSISGNKSKATPVATSDNVANGLAPRTESKEKNKKPGRPAFNSDEVAQFLRAQFTTQSKLPNTTVYSKPSTRSSPGWDTTANKWKSKKYSSLTDVARSLRSQPAHRS